MPEHCVLLVSSVSLPRMQIMAVCPASRRLIDSCESQALEAAFLTWLNTLLISITTILPFVPLHVLLIFLGLFIKDLHRDSSPEIMLTNTRRFLTSVRLLQYLCNVQFTFSPTKRTLYATVMGSPRNSWSGALPLCTARSPQELSDVPRIPLSCECERNSMQRSPNHNEKWLTLPGLTLYPELRTVFNLVNWVWCRNRSSSHGNCVVTLVNQEHLAPLRAGCCVPFSFHLAHLPIPK